MAKKPLVAGILSLVGAIILPVSIAQNSGGPKAYPKATIAKGLDAAAPGLGGQAFPIVANQQTLVVRRRKAGPNNASIHSTATDGQDFTEVMEVIEGSGTFMIGGDWIEKSTVEYNKRDRSKGIKGGVTYDAAPGDFFVIPPGTPHWFVKINDHVTVVETRLPGDVTKAKAK